MTNKRLKISLIILFIITVFLGASSVRADDTTIKTLDAWKIVNNVIQPRNASSTLKVPTLGGSGTKCLHTNNSGNISTSTADCGSGGGTFTTTTFNGLSSTAYTLVGGTNVTISTSSPGTITINSTGGGGISGSGTSTQVALWTSSSSLSSDVNFIWDKSSNNFFSSDNTGLLFSTPNTIGQIIQLAAGGSGHGAELDLDSSSSDGNAYLFAGANGNTILGNPGKVYIQQPGGSLNAILDAGSLTSSNKIFTFPDKTGFFAVASSSDTAGYVLTATSTAPYWKWSPASGGVSSLSSSSDISVSSSTGSGISFTFLNPNGYVTTTGARAALSAGSGIVYNSGTGVITNNGVLSLIAGTDISVSSATGSITVSNAFASSTWLKVANNLSDLNSSSSARTNIGFSAGTGLQLSSLGVFNSTGVLSLNGATGTISGANLFNSTTTFGGISGGITFSTTTSGVSFTITTSSQNVAFNFPSKLNTINGFATTTGGLIVATSSLNGWALLPVGANGKVLEASSTAANGLSWESIVNSLTGTTNQITLTAGTGNITASLPQNIDTAANVQFGSVTSTQLKTAATTTLATTNGFVAVGTSTLAYPFTVGDNLNGTNAYIALSPTSTAGISNLFQIKGSHIVATGTIPTASSCGSGPTIVGTDMAGTLTVGTGVVSSCTLTFAAQWVNPPACSVASNAAIASQTLAITTSTFIVGGTSVSGDIIPYICLGNEP